MRVPLDQEIQDPNEVRITCSYCGEFTLGFVGALESDGDSQIVDLNYQCPGCGNVETRTISRQRAEELGIEIRRRR